MILLTLKFDLKADRSALLQEAQEGDHLLKD